MELEFETDYLEELYEKGNVKTRSIDSNNQW